MKRNKLNPTRTHKPLTCCSTCKADAFSNSSIITINESSVAALPSRSSHSSSSDMVGEFLVRSIITISYVKLREDREGEGRRGGERVREGIKEEGGGG